MTDKTVIEGEAPERSEAESAAEVSTDGAPEAEKETEGALEESPEESPAPIDYESVIKEDIALLRRTFPELSGISDITELENPLRYAALRDLGLTPAEAYLATERGRRADTRSHLFGAVPRGASSPSGSMSQKELEGAREIFSGMSDVDIQKLYRKVTL